MVLSRLLPSMAPRSGRPCAHAIICADEVITSIYGVIAIRLAFDELTVDKGTAIATEIVSAQGVRKGHRGRGEKGRRKRSRLSLGEESNAGVEAKRQPK
jgi:hypothetical protein